MEWEAHAKRSGWKTETPAIAGFAKGAWRLEYKHWFDAQEPAAFDLLHAPITKPVDWVLPQPLDVTHPTTHGKSRAESQWKINTDLDLLQNAFVTYATRSAARARPKDREAHSKTRIRDPWTILSPQTDPDWNPDDGLDPEGRWAMQIKLGIGGEILGSGSVFGSFVASIEGLGEYSFFSYEVTQRGASVFTPALPDGISLLVYENTPDGDRLTDASGLESTLESYLTSSGWSLGDPDAWEAVDRSNTGLDLTLLLQMTGDVHAVVLGTETGSAANAAVPEPAGSTVMGLFGAWGLCWLRRSRRQKRS
jgi:hypothetical protein